MDIRAVAFDIDGTLYPNRAVYARLIPFALSHARFLIGFGRIRNELRATGAEGSFYDHQARLLGQYLRRDVERVRHTIEMKIYRGWEPLFRRIRLYPHLMECIRTFKAAGYRLGVLSDFPAQAKIKNLGLGGLFDVVLCSEETGSLKPDPKAFMKLAADLGVEPGEILFVGNSVRYDIEGAKQCGMRTALIARERKRTDDTDFVFKDYRDLRDYVLSHNKSGGPP